MTQLTTALGTVQAALYATLAGDATLMALVTGIFDEVPGNQPFNYVTIANNFELRDDTFGRRGRDVTLTLDIWTSPTAAGTQTRGFSPALAILDRCVFLLDRKPLALSSGSMAWINYDGSPRMVRDPNDQITRHVVARFQAYVEE